MNKIVNINLGGYPFQMDNNAYEHLSSYLGSIQQHFVGSEGFEEITGDIETRLAELFQEQLGSRPIVTRNDVQAAIAIMGTPEEFGADAIEEAVTYHRPQKGIKTGRRLFRNTDDKVLGGVCSGLAAYFGIKDPLWVRLILLVLTLTSIGFLIIAYGLLWIIVPEAVTASDRLAMRGEEINVSNISKIIEEEIEELPKRFSEAGETISKGFRSQKKNLDGASAGIRGLINTLFSLVAQIARAFLKAIGFIWKPILVIVSFALAISLIVTWALGAFSFFMSMPLVGYILPNTPWLAALGYTNFFLIIGIPLLSLLLLVIRGWTKFRLNNYWRAGLGTFWLLNLLSFVSVGIYTVRQFHAGIEIDSGETRFGLASDTLYLKSSTSRDAEHYLFRVFGDDELVLADNHLLVSDVEIEVLKSKTDQFETSTHLFSRGRNQQEAQSLLKQINFSVQKNGNEWTLPTAIKIPKGSKYRGQQVRYILRVPEGKHIVFDKGIDRSIKRFERADWEHHWWNKNEHVWTMTKEGFTRPESEIERSNKKMHHFVGYTNLQLEGKMEVDIEYTNADLSVEVEAKQKYQDLVEFRELNQTLYINSKARNSDETVKVHIKMPQLDYLLAKNTRDVEIKDFTQQKMTIDHEGEYEIDAFISVDSLTILQTDDSTIDLRGEGVYLDATVDESKLDTEQYPVRIANITGTNRSRFLMAVTDSLHQTLSLDSSVRLKGQTSVITRDTLR